MAFDVPPDAYERFMGRFSTPLAPVFCDAALPGLHDGARVLDVGCGPGMLTQELVRRVGEDHVSAVDPAPPFVAATSARFPGASVQRGRAEELPFADATFDAVLAQLVVHFMSDRVGGLREMARVTRPGGTVATCLWDQGGGAAPLSRFWAVAGSVDPSVGAGGSPPGTAQGELVALLREAGLSDVRQERVEVGVGFRDFDDWWEPFTFGVGPAGDYVRGLDEPGRKRLEDALREAMPAGPFTVEVAAWCAAGVARGH
ncbi:MAG: class I SAM-dependent methyltransferase [Nocardioidaceae bacterium]